MLNNDTVVAPDMLHCLLEVGQNDPKVGILMPKVLYYDDPTVIWSAGGRYRLFPPAIVFRGLRKLDDGQFDQPRFIEYAPGCGLLIHRQAFERAGLFDPGYFFLWDDWDFSERVRAHGLHIHFVPTAKMWHKVSKTTQRGGRSDLYWRTWGESATRFYKRHGRPVFLSLPIHIGYIMLREFVKGHGRALKYFLEGVRSGLNKPLGPIPTIQSQSWYHADH
jgi:GT2 family glycosyltransferase